jgi:uncharacterized protein (DUF1330 family)/catechol 2,3-dioxygenase-like lactoylglutathione lyase family enzyme
MFDHISLKVRDFRKSLAFYRAALAPLGFEAQHADEQGKSVGFGPKGSVGLWIAEGTPQSSAHVAFASRSRDAVARFHEAGLMAGGKDNGKAGLRLDYAKDYYAAFLLDPDGNNVEAVSHDAKAVYYMGTYDIVDAELFKQYPVRVGALLPKHGGLVLASDTSAHVLEGEARTMNAIVRFPSKEALMAMYTDPEYQEAKRIRQASTRNATLLLAQAFSR